MWDVEGTDEFEQWFKADLDARERAAIGRIIELLTELGPQLGRPHVDTLKGTKLANLKELRAHTRDAELRVLFAFDPRRTAVLLLGGNKSGKWDRWYRQAIPQAEAMYGEHLTSLERGEPS